MKIAKVRYRGVLANNGLYRNAIDSWLAMQQPPFTTELHNFWPQLWSICMLHIIDIWFVTQQPAHTTELLEFWAQPWIICTLHVKLVVVYKGMALHLPQAIGLSKVGDSIYRSPNGQHRKDDRNGNRPLRPLQKFFSFLCFLLTLYAEQLLEPTPNWYGWSVMDHHSRLVGINVQTQRVQHARQGLPQAQTLVWP